MLMYFSLGFLTAILLTLAIIPSIQNRTERLTIKRLEASIPVSIAEVEARADALRAEFAMTTVRLERTIEHLRSIITGYARELTKKAAIIHRLQSESSISETAGQRIFRGFVTLGRRRVG